MTTEATAPEGTEGTVVEDVKTEATATPLNLGDEGTPEVKVEAKAEEAKVISYEATGDAGLDMALEFMGKLGLDNTDPVMIAAGEGNFALLEAKLAGMGDKAKGWERYVALGKQSYEGVKTKSEAAAAKARGVVEDAVGGAENWTQIQTWAKENAEPEERAAVNAALAVGGIAAKAMAVYLAGAYERAANTTLVGRSAVTKDAANAGGPSSNALNPRAYTDEVAKLRGKLGGRMDTSPEYKALQARRSAWRG